ncbi:YjgP/YjgQ family permease [Mucilaginibacter pallidiroseus]|uniref:YjgP/YjgQ family permease n=1 Tax=Mucilaginibacter pallidiroseus TaxID=2599295 RepID=A0A563UCK3_9SPHI|nr:LptF/LptG family permease [Mucilaginibacter pallidiroseus]TWR29102.1 YjgP/YjgQ family permease [Mucilaginibacter pallidiroseus]
MRTFLHKYLTVIDRFIIKKYLGTFVFTLMIFLVISVIFDISEHLDNFLGKNASLNEIVFKYYAGFIPFYLNLLSPLINFLAVIFFTAKMANQTEIVPILTSRASFNRFLRPYFIASTLIFLVSFFANVYLIPFTNRLKIEFENANFFANDDPAKKEVHIQLDKNTFVYLDSYDPQLKVGYSFQLEKFDGDELKMKLTSPTISFDSVKTKWKINSPTIRKVDGLKESITYNGPAIDTVLDMRPVDFEVHDNVTNNIYGAYSLSALNAGIKREQTRGTGALTDMVFEKYRRFVEPLSSYVLAFIGVAISSRKVRGGVGLPLGIGIFICFTFIVVNRFAFVFAVKGGFSPMIAVFIPNTIFGILGYYLIKKAPK